MVNSPKKRKRKTPVASPTVFNRGVPFLPPFGFRLAFISSPCLCPLKVCCCARVLCTDKSSLLPCSFSFLLLSPAHPIIPSLSISAAFHHPSPVSTNIHLPPPPPPSLLSISVCLSSLYFSPFLFLILTFISIYS